MNRWQRLVEGGDCLYTVEDFEAAAYRLVAEQVLYYSDARARNAYRLVDQYELELRPVLELLGVDFKVNRQFRYAAAVPQHAKVGGASQDETLFALLLRKIYDEGLNRGDMTDEGEVHCDLVDLSERFRQETGRSMPEKGRLDLLMKSAKRWGIARMLDDEEEGPATAPEVLQPYVVAIRPAIADVLGENALVKLAIWRDAAATAAPATAPASSEEAAVEEAQ
jgi:hypothetical protein